VRAGFAMLTYKGHRAVQRRATGLLSAAAAIEALPGVLTPNFR